MYSTYRSSWFLLTAKISPLIDMWHIMSYDYAVSDITGIASATSPNSPLYTPSGSSGAVQDSINQTVAHYLAAGVRRG